MSADKVNLGLSVRDLDESPDYDPITCVRLITGTDSNGNDIVYIAGDPNVKPGRTLDVENHLIRDSMTGQAVVDNIYQTVQGYVYKPFSAAGAIIDPVAEIGDGVSIDEVYSVLADIETTFSPLMSATIGAPAGSDVDHEYPYESSEQRQFAQATEELRTALIVEQGKISSIVSQIGGENEAGSILNRLTTVEQTAEGITVYSEQQIKGWAGEEIRNWANLNFTADGINTLVGSYYDASGAADSAYDDAIAEAARLDGVVKREAHSELEQTSQYIRTTVAKSESKWDLTELPSGVEITLFGYGLPSAYYDATLHSGEYYLNQQMGRYYRSNGTTWVLQDQYLHLITNNLNSRITQTADRIESVVESVDELGTEMSKISQTATDITLEVYSSENGTTSFVLSQGSTTLSSQVLNLYVDAAYVKGTIYADELKAYASIYSPNITGGTIAGAVMNGGRFTDDGLGAASLSMVSWGGLASMVYAPTSRLSDWYGRTYSYFDVGGYGSSQYPQAWMELGGITLVEKRSTGSTSSFVMGGTTWDFSYVNKVIMPDGTVFEAS